MEIVWRTDSRVPGYLFGRLHPAGTVTDGIKFPQPGRLRPRRRPRYSGRGLQQPGRHRGCRSHPQVDDPVQGPAYNFAGLLALGASGAGAAEVGEVLTAVNAINAAGLTAQWYVKTFRELGGRLLAPPPGAPADSRTKRFRALRATQYYGQALFFVLGPDEPGSEEQLYRAGPSAWGTFCDLCEPAPVKANVPYRSTPLPVWFFRPDTSGTRRPTVILTNGSDGQNVDMWTYGVPAARERGWNALVYDGPGQGQLLFVDRVVFTPTWEQVVGPARRLADGPSGRRPEQDPPDGPEHGGLPGAVAGLPP
ncbi:hypothetical protein EDD96_6702 [Streptomyces sp. Ag109_G2-6]|nr:hypothetical protein EDD96_6702 [Streptomyces sp. Ag109_G2-6]